MTRGFWRTEKTDKGVSLMTSTGRRNDTLIAKFQGLGGNCKQASWDKIAHMHLCCGSLVNWRHKISCEQIKENIS